MRSNLNLLLGLLLLCLASFAARCDDKPGKGLIFYASFDKGADADLSKGSPLAQVKGKFLLEKSIFNGALKINYPCSIKYETDKNINLNEGSVMMWVKPLIPSWTQNDPQFGIFTIGENVNENFSFPNGNLNREIFRADFSLCASYPKHYIPYPVRVCEGAADLRAFLKDKKNKDLEILKAPRVILRGRWSHIALVWKKNPETSHAEIFLYRNGKLVAQNKSTDVFPKTSKNFYIGKNLFREEGTFLIDELKIYDKAFNANDIEKAYSN